MGLIDRQAPESDPGARDLFEDSKKRQGSVLTRREAGVEIVAASLFALVATAFALLVPGGRSFDGALVLALTIVYAVAARIEFRTGSGWTVPTQVVFVPMLFLIPINLVPLLVAGALLLFRLPEHVRGKVPVQRLVIQLGDSWHSLGPAAVFALAGIADPDWADWPVYLAALAAQFTVDFATSALREGLGYGLDLRSLAGEMRGIYLVDLLLSPVGLMAAFAAAVQTWAVLLVAPLLGLMEMFARERDARIENALALGRAFRGTAHLLGEMISGTHEYTGSHSRTVLELAEAVARRLGFDARAMRRVEFGALLHDVGKVAIPNEIIDKPGALDDEEWRIMKTHPVEGEKMLRRVGGELADAADVVRSHHERWDGGGYPDGLVGEQIPPAARVITACDSFNAMTTTRSYREAMSPEAAIEELRACAGTQFDPAIVEALVEVIYAKRAETSDSTTESPLRGV